jgi:amidase
MRQSQSGTSTNHNEIIYKSDHDSRKSRPSSGRQYLCLETLPLSTAVTIGIMVSAWLIIKAFVALAPLTTVYAQYGEASKLPLLLDATAEDLTAGLESGNFTSVDLVQVSVAPLFCQCYMDIDSEYT